MPEQTYGINPVGVRLLTITNETAPLPSITGITVSEHEHCLRFTEVSR
ncbi:hypothetical protein ES703_57684 [subsurface metagenome]